MKVPVFLLGMALGLALRAPGVALPAQAAGKPAEMTVSAAASLTNAFAELAQAFHTLHPELVVNTTFAASNPLLRQIVEGAPVDVLATADMQTMDRAVDAGVVNPASRRVLARNDLVLIVPKGEWKPASLADLGAFRHIAIGNPDSVPAGRYARDALASAGLWEMARPLALSAASVRQALDYVARGEAEAGFVYRTDALQMRDRVDIAMAVDGHEPVTYPIAVAATGDNPQAGLAFVEFAVSPAGQAILAKYGFSAP